MSSFDTFPVFCDLVFEAHRSPLIAAITAVRAFLFIYVTVLIGSENGLFDPAATCASARGTPPSDAAATAEVVLFALFTALAALAACRAQSRRWLVPACAAGAAYAGLSFSTQLPACVALMAARVGAVSGIVAVVLATLDFAMTAATLAALAALVAEDPAAALGAPAAADAPRARAALDKRRAQGGAGARAPGGARASWAAWLGDAAAGAAVAPLRHHLAVGLATVFCVAAAVAAGEASKAFRGIEEDWWSRFVDDFNGVGAAIDSLRPSIEGQEALVQALFETAERVYDALLAFIDSYGYRVLLAIYDFLWALTAGASLACVLVALSTAQSYVAILDDFARLAAAGAAAGEAAPLLAPGGAGGGGEGGGGNGGGADGAAAAASAAAPLLPAAAGAPAAAAGCCGGGAAAQPFAADGATLNAAFFSLRKAAPYTALFIVNLLTVFALTALVLTALIFFVTSRETRGSAFGAAATFAVSFLYDRFVGALFARFVAVDGGAVARPRLLALADFFLAVTLGAASGLTAGLVRFVLGVLKLLYDMTLLARPLAPAPFASLDGGFMAYGAMMKAATLAEAGG